MNQLLSQYNRFTTIHVFIYFGDNWILNQFCYHLRITNMIWLESNQRHEDFQSSALPTELSGRINLEAQRKGNKFTKKIPLGACSHKKFYLEIYSLICIYKSTYISGTQFPRWAFRSSPRTAHSNLGLFIP